jgi:hypothetical protein
MILTGNPTWPTNRQTRLPGGNVVTDCIGGYRIHGTTPVAFLAELPPGFVIDPHFHRTNQYQLVIAGRGSLGKHELDTGTLHYTDAESPYGPLVAGPSGLQFFTLRQTSYVGTHWMPGSKDLMTRAAGRNFVSRVDPHRKKAGIRLCGRTYEDGVSAYEVAAGPNAAVRLPDVRHGGAFNVVLAGEIRLEGVAYPSPSCMWVGADDRAPAMTAGDSGVVIAFLSFPRDLAARS